MSAQQREVMKTLKDRRLERPAKRRPKTAYLFRPPRNTEAGRGRCQMGGEIGKVRFGGTNGEIVKIDNPDHPGRGMDELTDMKVSVQQSATRRGRTFGDAPQKRVLCQPQA